MIQGHALLTRVLCLPSLSTSLANLQWDLLVRQARRADLLAELACRLIDADCFKHVPRAPRMHLESALRLVAQQNIAVHHEVSCIVRDLSAVDVRVVLLKGTAYLLSNLPLARGRMFGDVDILVPRAQIEEVETALRLRGWHSSVHDAYDQRYYRRWMHELPPMNHVRRGTTLDVHHSLLPDIGWVRVDTDALFESIEPVAGAAGAFVLSPVDMVLHSATHLFHEGEFDHALRDLFDLDNLLRHFAALNPAFWSALVPRAMALGVGRPLYYALRYTALLLETPVPGHVTAQAQTCNPGRATRAFMDACYTRTLQPLHRSTDNGLSAAARAVLYLRAHWLRMPAHLLAYHLARKTMLRLTAKPHRAPPAVPPDV